jgi:hypothetical protein
MTGGRPRPTGDDLEIEALVSTPATQPISIHGTTSASQGWMARLSIQIFR